MGHREIAAVLARVPLFEGLSKRDLGALARRTQEHRFRPGEAIVREGAPGEGFYVLTEGQARVVVGGRTRKRVGPGGFFGEVSLIDGGPRTATVQAETDVVAVSLSSWVFLPLLEENWPMTRKVLLEMCKRLREADRSVTL